MLFFLSDRLALHGLVSYKPRSCDTKSFYNRQCIGDHPIQIGIAGLWIVQSFKRNQVQLANWCIAQ